MENPNAVQKDSAKDYCVSCKGWEYVNRDGMCAKCLKKDEEKIDNLFALSDLIFGKGSRIQL